MAYEIRIDNFEGPLDLLLHLIRKNEMDIYNIPIAEITSQYLTILDAMKSLNLDVAGEFLVMAATLLQIKSRLLLPATEEEQTEEDEEDPRAELVRRLLEYQKYKEAAQVLDAGPRLDRDVFVRKGTDPAAEAPEDAGFETVGLYELAAALRSILDKCSGDAKETFHEVDAERLSVADRVNAVLALMAGQESLSFAELFEEPPQRSEVVVTFLAMLELVRMRLVRLLQSTRFGTIRIFPAVPEETPGVELEEGSLGYS